MKLRDYLHLSGLRRFSIRGSLFEAEEEMTMMIAMVTSRAKIAQIKHKKNTSSLVCELSNIKGNRRYHMNSENLFISLLM